MDASIYASYTLAYIVLLLWGMRLAAKNRWLSGANALLLVTAALIYDNGVLAIGHYIGEGSTLELLNKMRFWLHALCTPFLVFFARDALRRAGIQWAQKAWAGVVTYVILLSLILIELVTVVYKLQLSPLEKYGVLQYENITNKGMPSIMVIIITGILFITGLILWIRIKWPWLFIGVVIMTAGITLKFPVKSEAITNGYELVLLFSLMMTKRHQDDVESHPLIR